MFPLWSCSTALDCVSFHLEHSKFVGTRGLGLPSKFPKILSKSGFNFDYCLQVERGRNPVKYSISLSCFDIVMSLLGLSVLAFSKAGLLLGDLSGRR